MSRADVTLGDRQPTLVFADGLTCALESRFHGAVADTDDERLRITHADRRCRRTRIVPSGRCGPAAGFFDGEIVPVATPAGELAHDEGLRSTSAEALAGLQPAFSTTGTVTAGNASQMSDGAALGIVAGAAWVDERGVAPLALIGGSAHIAGVDGSLHERPAEAVERLLAEHDLAVGDIDVWEINEAFAGVVVASQRRLGIGPEHVNVNGGAIALGHPLAASGFRLVLTLARPCARRAPGEGSRRCAVAAARGRRSCSRTPKGGRDR